MIGGIFATLAVIGMMMVAFLGSCFMIWCLLMIMAWKQRHWPTVPQHRVNDTWMDKPHGR